MTSILNPDKFIGVNLAVAREWDRDLDKCPSYWHLCELARILQEAETASSTYRKITSDSTEPNMLIYLAYLGFAVLVFTFITLGIGLLRKSG
ncbi:DUF6965 family protein [Parapedobacter sp. DT-150]|uniref:DUF6965 family protein n=1 Tax=Parapedobacter sp. DT-150 TaxID=3396162 RepID=UPI003F1C7B0E